LLDEIKRLAATRNMPSAIITFPVHPRVILDSHFKPDMLNSFDEKIEHLSKTGIDYVFVLDFTENLSMMSARDFIHKVLLKKLNVRTLFIGYDHRFGHLRVDGFEKYVEYGKEYGMKVIKAPSFVNNGVKVSSSKIRTMLHSGNVVGAASFLGYNYRLKGHVIEGEKIGRTIGFPTANMDIDDENKLIPAFGSYAVIVNIDGKKYKGMLYIGKRPTLSNDNQMSIEVNIFDFSMDIYNKSISVEFIECMRGDMKFSSFEALKKQLKIDREKAKNSLMIYDL
jgi:riboflavin kinase/FMN adenylyltransferase